ncbi:MAG: phosphate acyltransferase PlsX [Clostridia bacterium]|nr:phosphate acyltransferase PlsX [Clostridia bacterium]
MKVIVDAMGGDNAPLEIIKGARKAADKFKVKILLAGKGETIRKCAAENNVNLDGMDIIEAESEISMCDDPKCILREKKDSSMAVAFQSLADGVGDAFVSAGSTGAVVMGATFIVKRIKGIKRPGIASIMPSYSEPFMIMDIGANVECHKENLIQFAQMSDIYMKNIIGFKKPTVALANIGAEPTKGPEVLQETYKALEEMKELNFIGNIEPRDIPFGKANCVVCNGFTGNIILKMYEGVASALMKKVKGVFTRNFISKIGYLLVKGGVGELKASMDYKEFGGAPLLGVKKPVIKAHGSSDERAIFNAIRQAIECHKADVCGQIAKLTTSIGAEE